jgi:hypothetical protein
VESATYGAYAPVCALSVNGASRHLRSSSVPVVGADSSRCRFPSSSSTAFNRGSFHPQRTGAARGHPFRGLRRPPTSCAHRLRKPDRTYELLAPHVARWAGGCGLLAPRLRARLPACDGSLAGRRTPVTFHHARPAVVAVGLERRLPDGPGHLPSDRPGPCGPSGLGFARCSRAPPRPAPGRSPRAWACLVKGRLVASSYPAPSRRRAARASQLRNAPERCVSPTSATDSRHEHPADRSIPGRPSGEPARWSLA